MHCIENYSMLKFKIMLPLFDIVQILPIVHLLSNLMLLMQLFFPFEDICITFEFSVLIFLSLNTKQSIDPLFELQPVWGSGLHFSLFLYKALFPELTLTGKWLKLPQCDWSTFFVYFGFFGILHTALLSIINIS